jgi:uncharacterized protein (DUF1330 family)
MAGYVVSIARVDDWTENFQKYADLAADLTAKLGAEYVIRGEPVTNCEGEILMIALWWFPNGHPWKPLNRIGIQVNIRRI